MIYRGTKTSFEFLKKSYVVLLESLSILQYCSDRVKLKNKRRPISKPGMPQIKKNVFSLVDSLHPPPRLGGQKNGYKLKSGLSGQPLPTPLSGLSTKKKNFFRGFHFCLIPFLFA